MREEPEPIHVSRALQELFALRGYARKGADRQLQEIWGEISGPAIAPETKAVQITRGVLQVQVSNAPLLGELTGFHKASLLSSLQQKHPELKIKDLKFRLASRAGSRKSKS
ncbi:MAG: DUF721 domain-containing protein [Planctomycetales bacterium]